MVRGLSQSFCYPTPPCALLGLGEFLLLTVDIIECQSSVVSSIFAAIVFGARSDFALVGSDVNSDDGAFLGLSLCFGLPLPPRLHRLSSSVFHVVFDYQVSGRLFTFFNLSIKNMKGYNGHDSKNLKE